MIIDAKERFTSPDQKMIIKASFTQHRMTLTV